MDYFTVEILGKYTMLNLLEIALFITIFILLMIFIGDSEFSKGDNINKFLLISLKIMITIMFFFIIKNVGNDDIESKNQISFNQELLNYQKK